MNNSQFLNWMFRFGLWNVGMMVVLLPCTMAAQDSFVVRAPFGGAHSPDYSREPISFGGVQSSRYQQVYNASEFIGLGGSPGNISWFAFQTDAQFGVGITAYLDLEILFGVTSRAPDSLSTTFAENITGGLSIVHSRGTFLMGSSGGGALVRFELETPFLYDPSLGNLLLEIRNYTPIPPPPDFAVPGVLEAWDVQDDSVSRVYAHDVNATTGIADTMGLNTYFVVTPVPEPSILVLLGLSLAGASTLLRNANRKPRA